MLRKLLACLALLTGLGVAGAPVQAEVAAAMASRIEASAVHDAAARSTARVVGTKLPTAMTRDKTAAPKAILRHVAFAPSVYLGVDRSRE